MAMTHIFLCTFRPPSQHEEVNRRRSRTNILLACITITFFVGWAPLVIFSLIYEFAEHWLPVKSSMKSLIYALSLLSGILTPIGKVLLLFTYYWLLGPDYVQISKVKCRLKVNWNDVTQKYKIILQFTVLVTQKKWIVSNKKVSYKWLLMATIEFTCNL